MAVGWPRPSIPQDVFECSRVGEGARPPCALEGTQHRPGHPQMRRTGEAGRATHSKPHDAPRRDTGKFFGAMEFEGECVSIRAGGAAHDTQAKLVASMASGILPGPIVGHRPFDPKEPFLAAPPPFLCWAVLCGFSLFYPDGDDTVFA